jgi:hypothetical protein
MKAIQLILVTLVAITMLGISSDTAQAGDFGIHFAGPGYHVDVGRPHSRFGYYGSYYGGRHWCPHNYHGGYRVWHDTSHYDYHPGEFVRHRNHYHYIPGHYDWHEDGHWDYGW